MDPREALYDLAKRSDVLAFNRKLLEDPNDNVSRSIFADWVEERSTSPALASSFRQASTAENFLNSQQRTFNRKWIRDSKDAVSKRFFEMNFGDDPQDEPLDETSDAVWQVSNNMGYMDRALSSLPAAKRSNPFLCWYRGRLTLSFHSQSCGEVSPTEPWINTLCNRSFAPWQYWSDAKLLRAVIEADWISHIHASYIQFDSVPWEYLKNVEVLVLDNLTSQNYYDDWSVFCKLPFLASVRKLNIVGTFAPLLIPKLAEADHLKNLTHLSLGNFTSPRNIVDYRWLFSYLSASPILKNLQQLIFHPSPYIARYILPFVQSPHLSNLQELDLNGMEFDGFLAAVLARSSLANLKRLRFGRLDAWHHPTVNLEGLHELCNSWNRYVTYTKTGI